MGSTDKKNGSKITTSSHDDQTPTASHKLGKCKNSVEKPSKSCVEKRVFKTAALYICFAGLGLASPLFGTTKVHMELLLHTTAKNFAFTFTVHAIGYLLGSFVCGVIYDRGNKEFFFFVAILIAGFTTICAPFCGNLVGFIAVMSLGGIAQGFIDTGGQSYGVIIWNGHRYKEMVFQAAHALWSLGAMIGPFVIQPFLVELATSSSNATVEQTLGQSTVNKNMGDSNLRDSHYFNTPETFTTSDILYQVEGINLARYAFVCVGSLILLSGVMYGIIYLRRCSSIIEPKPQQTFKNDQKKTVKNDRKTSWFFEEAFSLQHRHLFIRIVFYTIMFLYFYLYAYIELIPISYFSSFAIQHLHWSVRDSALVMSVFYGCHCFGRLAGVPLSGVLKPRMMIAINLAVTTLAYFMLLFVNHSGILLWISAALSGVGMATTFAAMVLVISETIDVSGRLASILVMGSATGGMTGPLLVGQLIGAYSQMWMVYVLVFVSVIHITLFAFFMWFSSRFKLIISTFSNKKITEGKELELSNLNDPEKTIT